MLFWGVYVSGGGGLQSTLITSQTEKIASW